MDDGSRQKIEALEGQVLELRRTLDALVSKNGESRHRAPRNTQETVLSRRNLLRGLPIAAAAVGVSGLAAGALANPVAAADGDPIVLGQNNVFSEPTTLSFDGSSGHPCEGDDPCDPYLYSYFPANNFLVTGGLTTDFLDVSHLRGKIELDAGRNPGITGTSLSSAATITVTNAGTGAGVYAANSNATGLTDAIIGAGGAKGRGGKFRGGAANINLQPSTASTHPASGSMGDLFADKTGRLWFCKGKTVWKQLA